MGQVHRIDQGEFRKPERMPNGWLRADAFLTRVGVFTYLQADNSIRRELRPPEEVFDEESLSSLRMVPVTRRHPRDDDGQRIKLHAGNAKRHSVGSVGENIVQDGIFAKGTVMLVDADAVIDAEVGTARQLSCGYDCELEPTTGVTRGLKGIPDGIHYDAVQRNIRYNHVALEPVGRAGPEVGIRLDAGDAVMVDDREPLAGIRHDSQTPQNPQENRTMAMVKVRLDGVDYEVSEQAAQAVNATQQKATEQLEAVRTELTKRHDAKEQELKAKTEEVDKLQARVDSLEDELKQTKQQREDALKPETIREAVKARVDLERSALRVLGEKDEGGKDRRFDSLADAEIRRQVILKVFPGSESKLANVNDTYITARFDSAVEAFDRGMVKNESLDNTQQAANSAQNGTRNDAGSARQKFNQKEETAWKDNLASTK